MPLHSIVTNDVKVEYDDYLAPRCSVFIRHAMGEIKAGWSMPLCDKYRKSKGDDIINMASSGKGGDSIPVRKSDYVSLDDLTPWAGVVPIRALYYISRKHQDHDPDLAPSYLPYDSRNKVSNYIVMDRNGYEVSAADRKRNGCRFYGFLGTCYLATEDKPSRWC